MLNSNKYNFQFFLAGSEVVKDLITGAKKNGGATQFKNQIISNIAAGDLIDIKKEENEISLFIPSTTNVNIEVDNQKYIDNIVFKLAAKYNLNDLTFYNTNGSWYDEEANNVVIEKITIVTLRTKEINDLDIRFFINLAEYLKKEMNQQAVSISINSSLAIV